MKRKLVLPGVVLAILLGIFMLLSSVEGSCQAEDLCQDTIPATEQVQQDGEVQFEVMLPIVIYNNTGTGWEDIPGLICGPVPIWEREFLDCFPDGWPGG